MLTRLLFVAILAVTQFGCDVEYGEYVWPFEAWNLDEVRSRLEREKREFLKIEDLQVGTGAVAAWGRRLNAEIEIRYAEDGAIIYKGPIVTYFGFKGLLPSDLSDRFMLNFTDQGGIELGLNGMAVGGRRRITISPELKQKKDTEKGDRLLLSCFPDLPPSIVSVLCPAFLAATALAMPITS